MHRTDVADHRRRPGRPGDEPLPRRRAASTHVVLERGRIGERWRSERWDSLRLLTPNWMTRLPGHRYAGPDPDGFMPGRRRRGLLDGYAARRPRRSSPTTRGASRRTGRAAATASKPTPAPGAPAPSSWPPAPATARACPACAARLPAASSSSATFSYRRPGDLPAGGVLVVGASASGRAARQEIRAAGRPVTLAAGRHIRMVRALPRPRHLRLDGRRRRHSPSAAAGCPTSRRRAGSLRMQLVRRRGRIDLARLAGPRRPRHRPRRGRGRRAARAGRRPRRDCAAADARLHRVLARIDAHIAAAGVAAPPDPAAWAIPRASRRRGRAALDLAAEGIGAVVWATGYRRDYAWLRVPVLDADGRDRARRRRHRRARPLRAGAPLPVPPHLQLHRRGRARRRGAGRRRSPRLLRRAAGRVMERHRRRAMTC